MLVRRLRPCPSGYLMPGSKKKSWKINEKGKETAELVFKWAFLDSVSTPNMAHSYSTDPETPLSLSFVSFCQDDKNHFASFPPFSAKARSLHLLHRKYVDLLFRWFSIYSEVDEDQKTEGTSSKESASR